MSDEGFFLVDKINFAKSPRLEGNLLILYLVIRLKRGGFCHTVQDSVECIYVDEVDSTGDLNDPGGRRFMKWRSVYDSSR